MRHARKSASVVAVLAAATSSHAAVLAYDGFDYVPGPLSGNNGGTGFATPWLADPGVAVSPPGLSSALAQPSTGFALEGIFNYKRQLSTTIGLNRTVWASFLVQNVGAGLDQTYMGLDDSFAGVTPRVAFGIQLAKYGVFLQGVGFIPSAVPFSGTGSTDFLLARITLTGANTIVDLFVNPTTLGAPDVTGVLPFVVPLTHVFNQNQSQFRGDEVRIGDTAAEAGWAVPAPGAAAFIGLGVLAAARRRR